MKLLSVINKLNQTRDEAIKLIGKTISLASDAGEIIAVARTEGKDVLALCEQAGITEEVGKRYEKVAASQSRLTSGDADPGLMRQTYLRIGMLPDPITMSEPSEPKPFLWPVIKVSQWLSNKGIKYVKQNEGLRNQFLTEAEPIVRAYKELGGRA
jgi:hypothetical protein